MLGKPKFPKLTPNEKHLFNIAGLETLFQTSDISSYNEIFISKCNRVVRTEGKTMRNDSYIVYFDSYGKNFGLVQSILVFKSSEALECFVVVKTLTTAMLSLCNDPITHAKLDHIQAFNPPRLVYVTDLEYITSCKKAVTIHTTNLSESLSFVFL